jgi:cytochrome c-type biogenesis protein CcmH/NrfF
MFDFRKLAGLAVMLGMTVASLWGAGKPSVKAIGDGVVCQCGCNFTVSTCNHEQCSSRDEMRAMAQKEIDAGKSETAILQDFVLRYGVKVLSTPPAGAFNSTVWILPGFAVIIGLGAAVLIVRKWRKPPRPPAERGGHDVSNIDPSVLSAIEEEMEKSGIKE